MDEGEAETDGQGTETGRSAFVSGAKDDHNEHSRHHHFAEEAGCSTVLARGMFAVSVAGEPSGQTEVRFARGNGVEHAAGQNGAQTLGDDIRNEIPAREPAAEPEAHGDSRVEMAARNVAEGVRSGQDGQSESKCHSHKTHARIGEGAGVDGRTAAAKNKPERTKKFCQILFHKQPAQDPAACRGECRLLFPWLLKYAGLRHFPGRRLTQTHAAESREKNRNPYAIPRLLYAPYDPCHFFSMPEKPCIFSALFRHTSPCVPLFPLLPSFPSCFTYIIKISQKI